MSRKVVTTKRMIIDKPHVAYVSYGNYSETDMKPFIAVRRALYKNSTSTVGFSEIQNGDNGFFSYVFFEDEQDLLSFMLIFKGLARKAHMWTNGYRGNYTFYTAKETQLS